MTGATTGEGKLLVWTRFMIYWRHEYGKRREELLPIIYL